MEARQEWKGDCEYSRMMTHHCSRCKQEKPITEFRQSGDYITGYCKKCNKEYCNNHYHAKQKVDRKSPSRNEYSRNRYSQKKKYYEVICKCPYDGCGQLHKKHMNYKPIVMPRIACEKHEWCRYEEEPIIYAV